MTAACALLAPGQPCARWATPPLGVCSRQGGARVCGDCHQERLAALIREDHARMARRLHVASPENGGMSEREGKTQ